MNSAWIVCVLVAYLCISNCSYCTYVQEVDKISKALKDDEFRKLFFEYAQEISDPENKKVRV